MAEEPDQGGEHHGEGEENPGEGERQAQDQRVDARKLREDRPDQERGGDKVDHQEDQPTPSSGRIGARAKQNQARWHHLGQSLFVGLCAHVGPIIVHPALSVALAPVEVTTAERMPFTRGIMR